LALALGIRSRVEEKGEAAGTIKAIGAADRAWLAAVTLERGGARLVIMRTLSMMCAFGALTHGSTGTRAYAVHRPRIGRKRDIRARVRTNHVDARIGRRISRETHGGTGIRRICVQMVLVGVCMRIVGRVAACVDWGRSETRRVRGGRVWFDSRFAGDTAVA